MFEKYKEIKLIDKINFDLFTLTFRAALWKIDVEYTLVKGVDRFIYENAMLFFISLVLFPLSIEKTKNCIESN